MYHKAATNSYDQQNLAGTVLRADDTYVINKLEIQGDDMSLQSESTEAEENPDSVRIVIMEEDVDAVTENTDLKAYLSRDNGGNWVQATLVDEGDYGSGLRVLTGTADVSGQASDKTMKWKITGHNDKDFNLHGIGVLWN